MSYTNGSPFSTHDRDNDGCGRYNCAKLYKGGWWYKDDYCNYCLCGLRCDEVSVENHCCPSNQGRHIVCTKYNPNGDYYGSNGENIFSKGMGCNLNFTEMKIRPA